jgi:hypothetical protein
MLHKLHAPDNILKIITFKTRYKQALAFSIYNFRLHVNGMINIRFFLFEVNVVNIAVPVAIGLPEWFHLFSERLPGKGKIINFQLLSSL